MNNELLLILLSFMAGMATLLGAILSIYINIRSDKFIAFSLAFTSGVMILISLVDLIPESINNFNHLNNNFLSGFVLLISLTTGMVIIRIVDKKMDNFSNNLYKIGLISMIGIVVHNFPEGIVTYVSGLKDISLGITLAIAIGIHNIPEGIAIAIPLYHSKNNRRYALLLSLLAGLSEPFGAIMTHIFLKNYINDFILGIIYALTAGIMIFIAIEELFTTSIKYNYKFISLLGILIGFSIMLLSHLFI